MKRGNAGSWNSGLEKEQILETYSAHLKKSWNSTKVIFGNNKKYWAEEIPEGAHTLATRVGARPTPLGAPPCLMGPLVALRCPSSTIWSLSLRKKIISKLSGQDSTATWQNHGETNLGLRRSCSAGETSLREGEIIAIVITNAPLIGRGPIFINIFTSTVSTQTLVHLLYPIFVPKPQIGTCGLLVVLITPCSWC